MGKGFDVEVELPQDDIDKLIKEYKKVKKAVSYTHLTLPTKRIV